MRFQLIPYLAPLAASSALCLALAAFGLARRSLRGARELAVCGFLGALWAASNGLEMAGADLATKLLWANVQYFAYAFSPLAWLALVFRFSGKDRRVNAQAFALLAMVPTATSVLVWLDPDLGLVRHSFSLDERGAFPVIAKSYGPWFYVHFAYSYLLNGAAIASLVGNVRDKGALYRGQSASVLAGLGLIFASNLAFVLRLPPFARYDVTPAVFGVSAVILWTGILRFRIFKLQPVARAIVFESMASGMLVVDDELNLIDSNASARRMLGLEAPDLVGRSLVETRPAQARAIEEARALGAHPERLPEELRLGGPSGERILEIRASRLRDDRYRAAWVVVVEDVTELRLAREEIERQREELAAADEREKLSQELHDDLGQVLSFAAIQTDAVIRALERGDRDLAAAYLARLRDIVKGAHEDLRRLVRGIRGAEYETVPLAALLEREAESFGRCCGEAASASVSPAARQADPAPWQKEQLIRVVKEALNNVARHAKATRAGISFTLEAGAYAMTIEDDGVGLGRVAPGAMEGSGLGIMAERARMLGGSLRAETRDEGGTRLVLAFPENARQGDEDTRR
jgi:PAS domain S-box-containing protein